MTSLPNIWNSEPNINAHATVARIPIVDLYRFLAILGVIIAHYTVRWTPPREGASYYPYGSSLAWAPLEVGGYGVALFFVVSGFVIFMTLERSPNVIDFALKRFARLWPAMLICATLTTLALNVAGPESWRVNLPELLLSIAFIPPTLVGKIVGHPEWDWVDGAYWSLFVEVRFYVVAAIFYLVFGRKFLFAWAALQVASFAANLTLHDAASRTIVDTVLLLHFMPYFSLGIYSYALVTGRLRRCHYLIAFFALWCAALVTEFCRYGADLRNAAGFMAAATVVYGASLLLAFDLPVRRYFWLRPLTALGRASYSLYLIHQLFGIVVLTLVGSILPPYFALAATLVVIVGLSLTIFYFVELPGRALLLNNLRPIALASRHLRILQFRADTRQT